MGLGQYNSLGSIVALILLPLCFNIRNVALYTDYGPTGLGQYNSLTE